MEYLQKRIIFEGAFISVMLLHYVGFISGVSEFSSSEYIIEVY